MLKFLRRPHPVLLTTLAATTLVGFAAAGVAPVAAKPLPAQTVTVTRVDTSRLAGCDAAWTSSETAYQAAFRHSADALQGFGDVFTDLSKGDSSLSGLPAADRAGTAAATSTRLAVSRGQVAHDLCAR